MFYSSWNKKFKIPCLILASIFTLFIGLVILGYFFDKNYQKPILTYEDKQEKIIISQGTQGRLNNLLIGVFSVSKSNYEDENGVKREGLTSLLQLSFLDDNSKNQKIEVYEGKKFFAGQYAFVVNSIQTGISFGIPGRPSGSVELLVRNAKDVRLEDPTLIYGSFSSSGMCSNERGESGGCSTNIYLYSSGELLKELYWYGGNKQNISTSIKKQIDEVTINSFISKIKESGIMTKNCPPELIIDASWSYQIRLNGIIKIFKSSPPIECRTLLNEIEGFINSANN